MSNGATTAARYYCHRCRSNTSVFRATMPICGACQSPFVEEIFSNSNESERPRSENEETEQLSEQLTNGLAFQQYRQVNDDNCSVASSASTNEPVTDDGDENYEDIEEDEEEDEEDEDEDDLEYQPWRNYYDDHYSEDEEDVFLNPWRRFYRRTAQEQYLQPRQAPTSRADEYDIDQYYDEILDEVLDYNSQLADEDHHLYRHRSHFHSGRLPMIEQLLSMLYDGNSHDINDPNHPLSSILHDMLHNDDSSVQRVAASPEQIEKLEKRQLQEGDTEVETECIICQDTFGVGAEIIKMPCKHEYHGKCIRHWLSVSTTCPMCRSSLQADERLSTVTSSDREERPDGQIPPNGRTFTFQSPTGSTTVGIWVADPSTLPNGLHNLARDYLDNDDENDEDEDNDSLGYGEDSDVVDNEFDEDYDEYDEYGDDDEDNEDNLMWNFFNPMFHVCPHSIPRVPPAIMRQARSLAGTTRTEQQQNSRPFNPMDELD